MTTIYFKRGFLNLLKLLNLLNLLKLLNPLKLLIPNDLKYGLQEKVFEFA